jgi:hypothetical protein
VALSGGELGLMVRILHLLAAMVLLGSTQSYADANWTSSNSRWKSMDNCARAAFKRFPDYTKEGNAQRDRFRQQCLAASNLPHDEKFGSPPASASGDATGQPR